MQGLGRASAASRARGRARAPLARAAAPRWVIKVVTVGGTLALSGGVVGAAILALASVVVYAVFASAE